MFTLLKLVCGANLADTLQTNEYGKSGSAHAKRPCY